jgi:serine/threonine protein phosphatase PrpC
MSIPGLQSDPVAAYGSTLVAAAVTKSVAVVLQLGDGDIVWLSGSGQVMRPLPRDPRLLGNETVSLCSPDAVQSMCIRLKHLATDDDERPDFMLLSTDGYANCFKDETAFTQAARDYAELLKRRDGIATVRENVGEWLRKASDEFSRDDITVALLCRSATTRPKKHATSAGR